MSDNLLSSRVWLTTGASRAFGRALAEAVLAAGHKLVVAAQIPELVLLALEIALLVLMCHVLLQGTGAAASLRTR